MKNRRETAAAVRTAVRIAAIAAGAVCGIGSVGGGVRPAQAAGATAASTPVIVELFTSEGCSDCPPADDVLARLAERPEVNGAHVIVLSEHVDYWNRLGWRDPFSDEAFSRRQSEYAGVFHNDQVYTPQMVVDGRAEFIGSDQDKAVAAIASAAHAPHIPVDLRTTAGGTAGAPSLTVSVRVQVPDVELGEYNVYLAVTEDGLRSQVARGENAGRTLTHSGVTRLLRRLATTRESVWSGTATQPLSPQWQRQKLHLIAFVQKRTSGRIFGAAEVRL